MYFILISMATTVTLAKPIRIYTTNKRSAIVIDYTGDKKVLLNEHADSKRYPASLTKVMTLYLIFDALKNKKIKMNTKFKVSSYAARQIPSKLGIKAGSKISVENIIKALIVKSANDVAIVAAEGLAGNVSSFCKLMNATSKKLGMHNTHFENPSGVPNTKQVSTARDIAKLGMAIYHDFPQYNHFFSLKDFTYNRTKHRTHCKILKWYKGADGAKTGYTCASGFNLLVTAIRYNKLGAQKRLFVVVMGRNSAKERDLYAGTLMDRYYGSYNLTKKNISKKSAKNELMEQVSKAEMLEDVVYSDEEILISKTHFNAMLDDLYKDNEELVSTEEEILITPRKEIKKKH